MFVMYFAVNVTWA